MNLSEALDLAGHTDEALEVVRGEVGTLGERPERSTFDAFLMIQQASLLLRLGRLAEARAALPGRVPGEAVSYAWLFWRETRARIALLTGDLDGVRAELDALVGTPAEPQWVEPRADLEVELAVREDRLEDARGVLRAAARGSSTPTRPPGCCGWRGWSSASRPRSRAARRRSARPTSPRSTTSTTACAGAPGRPWFDEAGAWCAMADAERRRRRTLLGDAPADPGGVGGRRAPVRRPRAPDARRLRALPRGRGARDRRRPRRGRRAAARRRTRPRGDGRRRCSPPTSRRSRGARGSTSARSQRPPRRRPTTPPWPASGSPRASSRCCCSSPRGGRTA